MKQHRQPGFGEDLVERVGEAVVGEELLDRRVQLEAANAAAGNQPPRLGDRGRAAVRIDADERHRDVGVVARERQDVVVGEVRPAGQPFVDGEDDAAHLSRAVVLRQRRGAGFAL